MENPNPGKADGNIHYHTPDNTKYDYDIGTRKLYDRSGNLDPKSIQKVIQEAWLKKH